MQRVLEAKSALRNGGRKNLVQFRGIHVTVHQTPDEFAGEFLQRSRGVGSRRLPDDLLYIVDVSVMKGGEDCALVGEVLIKRPDANAGGLRDAIRGDGLGPVTLHHKWDRLEHAVHGMPRALLLRLAPRQGSSGRGHAASSYVVPQPNPNRGRVAATTPQGNAILVSLHSGFDRLKEVFSWLREAT